MGNRRELIIDIVNLQAESEQESNGKNVEI